MVFLAVHLSLRNCQIICRYSYRELASYRLPSIYTEIVDINLYSISQIIDKLMPNIPLFKLLKVEKQNFTIHGSTLSKSQSPKFYEQKHIQVLDIINLLSLPDIFDLTLSLVYIPILPSSAQFYP